MTEAANRAYDPIPGMRMKQRARHAVPCALIAERAVTTLVLINKAALATQWREQIRTLLGVKAGQLGGGRTKTRGQVDVMLLQSLARHSPEGIAELARGYGQVIVDECHHLAAGSYESFVSQIAAAWWLGLTATPERKDGLEQVIGWQVGPIRHVIRDTLPSDASLVSPYEGPLRKLYVHQTSFRGPAGLDMSAPGVITQLGGLLADDPERNRQIAADIAEALSLGRKCLVLSRRRDHLTSLARLLPDAEVLIMRGGTGAKALAAIRARIADASPTDSLLVMTTVPYGGEGFDAPVIDTVFLVGPIAEFWLIPWAASDAGRASLSWLLGEGETRGIALVFTLSGVLGVLLTLGAFLTRSYRLLTAEYAVGVEEPDPALEPDPADSPDPA